MNVLLSIFIPLFSIPPHSTTTAATAEGFRPLSIRACTFVLVGDTEGSTTAGAAADEVNISMSLSDNRVDPCEVSETIKGLTRMQYLHFGFLARGEAVSEA